MNAKIREILSGKKILILGYGKEGRSTYSFLRENFPGMSIGIADQNETLAGGVVPAPDGGSLVFHLGSDYLDACRQYDLVIKSPGLPYDLVTRHCRAGMVTSQTDLFLKAFSARTIGVTGTKGKSTTTTLIYHLMKSAGRNVILAGNIGIPPLSLAGKMGDDVTAVFEMSSHQLEHITVAPGTAVILNIFPEHLDHYRDFTAYKMAKFNISLLQPENACLVYHGADPIVADLVKSHGAGRLSRYYTFSRQPGSSAWLEGNKVIVRSGDTEYSFARDTGWDLPGEHNLLNLMAALLVCVGHGMEESEILEGLATFRRPEHRLELAGTFGGITFYNDSIATVPQATIQALKTIGRVDLLILGGFDRGLEYDELYEYLRSHTVRHLAFLGEAGRRMHDELQKTLALSRLHMAGDMNGVFEIVRRELSAGDVCLLSPAAASYDMFSDFTERGAVFKKMAAGI